jgi:hypothetical protein
LSNNVEPTIPVLSDGRGGKNASKNESEDYIDMSMKIFDVKPGND